jgi:molybdenum cofactor biosynthesis enzyme MoaA
MVFANPLQINRFIELMPEKNVATEYFDDLLKQKVATQTHEEVIVYKFDKFSHGSIDCYRVKVKNTSVVKFLNTYTDYISNVNYKEGDIIGWVFGITLKKVKQK